MFTPDQYRKKASEYCKLVRLATNPNQTREFQSLERNFTELADNAQGLSDKRGKVVHAASMSHLVAPPLPWKRNIYCDALVRR
jgi:hypothetical protein